MVRQATWCHIAQVFLPSDLDTLLENPAILEHMRLAARPSVLQFSWKHVANQCTMSTRMQ